MKIIFTCILLMLFSAQTYAKDTQTLTYKFYDGDCDTEIVNLVKGPGVKLVFTTVNSDMPLLIGTANKGASLSNKVTFTKEGIEGWDMYMSLDSTEYQRKDLSLTLENLWLKQKANRDNAPTTSAFYLGRGCLVSNVPMDIPTKKKGRENSKKR